MIPEVRPLHPFERSRGPIHFSASGTASWNIQTTTAWVTLQRQIDSLASGLRAEAISAYFPESRYFLSYAPIAVGERVRLQKLCTLKSCSRIVERSRMRETVLGARRYWTDTKKSDQIPSDMVWKQTSAAASNQSTNMDQIERDGSPQNTTSNLL